MPILIFEVEAPFSGQRFIETLKPSVLQSNWLFYPRGSTPFTGMVSEDGFRIIRTIRRRNSFNPVIYGKFLESVQGTRVRVLMTFHPFVWLFIVAWPFLTRNEILPQLEHYGIGNANMWNILFMFAPLLVGIPFFFYEAAKSKKMLLQTLGLNTE